MCKFKNHFKWILIILSIAIFCCSCNKSYSEINTELTGVLSKQYGFYLSDATEFVDAEYKVFAERNPYLEVIVDVSGDDIRDVFDEKMWDQNNIESSIKGDIGVETFVDWIYNDENVESHYYYARLCITKIKADLYRACFCGYGVNTQYFEN